MLAWLFRNVALVCLSISLPRCASLRAGPFRSKNRVRIFGTGETREFASLAAKTFGNNFSFILQQPCALGTKRSRIFSENVPFNDAHFFGGCEEKICHSNYDFPLYERKWQDFWEKSKLFQAQDPHGVPNVRDWCDNRDRESDANVNGPGSTKPTSGDSEAARSLAQPTVFSDNGPKPLAEKSDGSCQLQNTAEAERKPKYYILSMIPYPSGKGLHVGHLLGYTAVDVIARYKRMNNYNVLNPVGFDCFGIPTEVYSKKVGRSPEEATRENVDNFRKQLKRMGFSFDFSREIMTCDAEYYRWTQWIFQQMFLRGLAYRDKDYVNYCPELGSELSNEEVRGGRSVRGDFDVYKRLGTTWKLRITEYAQRLHEDLDLVDYPEKLVALQKNWIGMKRGYLVTFPICSSEHSARQGSLHAFVEDLDSCLAAESVEVPVLMENVLELCTPENRAEVEALLEQSLRTSNLELADEKNRKRVPSGLWVTNPRTGARIPVYVTNAPIHLNRDVTCRIGESCEPSAQPAQDLPEGDWYREYVHFNIRDWVFSRNRGWGEPIPVSSDTPSERREDMLRPLPVLLSGDVRETMPQWAGSCWHFLRFTDPDNAREPFSRARAAYWLPVDLYVGGVEHAVSHLLYSRFWNKFLHDIGVSPVAEPFKKILLHGVVKTAKFYLTEEQYGGLNEHARREVDEHNRRQAAALEGASWKQQPGWVEVPERMVRKHSNRYVLKIDPAVELRASMKKMSKSRGNVVGPEEVIDRYGSDALRLHLMFLGPVDRDKVWSVEAIAGVFRLLRGIHEFCSRFYRRTRADEDALDADVAARLNAFVETVTNNMEQLKLNKISEFFTLFRQIQEWARQGRLRARVVDTFLKALHPFAPHLTEELWHLRHLRRHGRGAGAPGVAEDYTSIAAEKWPGKINVV